MRARIFAILVTTALFALAAVPASANPDAHSYLALGDSVAFGYSPLIAAGGPSVPPSAFVGYPDTVAATLDLPVVNASCPGETTAGLIDRTAARDYKCLFFLQLGFKLHTTYSGSQLEFALNYLSTHPTVSLVTIDAGANDVFKLETSCGGRHTDCFANGISAVLASIDANLRFILGEIRNVANYHHALVVLTYYSISYDALTAGETQLLNARIIGAATAYGGIVANGFAAFMQPALNAGGSSCAAGLLVMYPGDGCDVHPSPAGHHLLAGAVVDAIATSCPAESVMGCMERNQG